jgi:glutamine cyclotransferase
MSAKKRRANPRGASVPAPKKAVKFRLYLIVLAALAALVAFGIGLLVFQAPDHETPVLGHRVVARFPHDPEAFAQGLLFHDGHLYESTGLRGRSSLRKVEIETGRVLRRADLEDRYFGEGLVLWKDRLIQLTYTSGKAFVYDLDSFEKIGEFEYEGEGWGITHDGRELIMSDGSSVLTFRNPDSFEPTRRLRVRDGRLPVSRLNELEHINGHVFANIWRTDRVAMIDPASGEVTAWVDFRGLLSETDRAGRDVDVLNGLAHDPESGRIFVTGKLWPALYEIDLVK